MEFVHVSSSVGIKTISEDAKEGVFEIEGLYAGYGLTIGTALRRALLSSLPGAAVTEIKIKNVPHEFSTLPGLQEDIVELALNFKKLHFRAHVDEPQVLLLKMKGEGEITAGDIELNSNVELINPEEVLGHLTAKDAEIDMGYVASESRKAEGRLPIGTIAIDAIFTPVIKVNYTIDDMRVGDRTDYNRLRLEVTTNGTISPSSALHKAANILKDHFEKVGVVEVKEFDAPKAEGGKKKAVAKKK